MASVGNPNQDHGKRRIAVVGATGYTGQELLRLLARHPAATAAVVMTARQDH
jgi:N-acetyl-gamma-glutamylphosphate reductase